MAYVELRQVQQWLAKSKHTLTTYDPDLEESAVIFTKASLATSFDVSGWTDKTNTPALVQQIIALLVAAWEYNRAYSEDDDSQSYGDRLEKWAFSLVRGIKEGRFDLLEVEGFSASAGLSFYPNDLSSTSEVYDEMGVLVGAAGSEGIKFRMSGRY